MSKRFNTDGMYIVPSTSGPELTATESIECAIAFDVASLGELSRRTAWVYCIVYGVDDDDSWNIVASRWGWDDADRKRASDYHFQWLKVKDMLADC